MNELNLKDLDRLTSELSSFARSDVPMPEGLRQLCESIPAGRLKKLTGELAEATAQGQPLSGSLRSSSIAVPPSFAALVRCGEISGDMGGVLDFALENGRRLRRHRASMSTLFVYPMLVLLVLLVIISFATTFIVPKFQDIYDQLGAELPEPTQVAVNISSFFLGGGFIVLPLLALVFLYLLVAAFREKLPPWLLNWLPGVRNLVYLSDTAVMTEFIGHLLAHGVPLPEACRAAALVVSQNEMHDSLVQMAATAEQGGVSSHELNPRIPATAAWLYRQGEARGTLVETCRGIALYCESRFDLLSRRTLYLMEPLFILMISVLCGFFVISLYLPLFNIPKLLGR
jgi:type II secretory pathway component PulF